MIFIDTGAFIARYLARDQYHSVALKGWARLEQRGLGVATSNLVLSETITLLSRWGSSDFAVERANEIYTSRVLTILRSNEEDELEALTWMEKFADQDISFADAVSFALMKRQSIKKAFSFDRHFKLAGFQIFR